MTNESKSTKPQASEAPVTYFTKAETNIRTPLLARKKKETIEEAEQRFRDIGYDLEKVVGHWNAGSREYHTGTSERCLRCNRQAPKAIPAKDDQSISDIRPKNKSDRIFIHKPLTSIEQIIEAWGAVPDGRIPIAYMHYKQKDGVNGLHTTMFYVPCGLNKAVALFLFSQQLSAKIPSIDVKVLEPTTINSVLFPGKNIWQVKFPILKKYRAILDRLSDYGCWLPHITDHSGAMKKDDTLTLIPEFEVIYQKNSTPADHYDPFIVDKMAESLKIEWRVKDV